MKSHSGCEAGNEHAGRILTNLEGILQGIFVKCSYLLQATQGKSKRESRYRSMKVPTLYLALYTPFRFPIRFQEEAGVTPRALVR